MAFGVTDEGFQAKRTEDITEEMDNDLRATFGDGIDLSDSGPFGQIVKIFSDRLGSIWSFMEQVYDSQYPSTSEGTSLDNVAELTGSVRQVPTSSKVSLTLFGDVATVIPQGSTVSVLGNTDAKFNTDEAAIIAPGIDNVQNIALPTLPEAGSFTLDFGGSVTAAIQWNDNAATIQAALEALTNIGAGNVTVLGDVQSGAIAVTFLNDLGSAPQTALLVSVNGLTSAETTQLLSVADVSANLDRTTVVLQDKDGSVGVWIDVDNSGSSVPPAALAADRQIEVTGVVSDDSANSVATAWAAALDADPEFSASAVGNVITAIDAAQGTRTPDGADVDTGFTVSTTKQGFSAGTLPVNITETTTGVLPQAPVGATAQTTGPTLAIATTLSVIETPVTGWTSVTNPLDAVPGENIEDDPDFRLRRLEEIAIAGRATTEAIRSQLLKIDLVTAVVVFENDLSIVDIDGRPPKSVDIVVEGGDEDTIAQGIFDVVASGIERIGDITKVVVDSQGFSQTQKFSRPTPVDIFVEFDLTVNSAIYPVDGDAQVKAAVVAHGDALGIGTDVIVHGSDSLECAISEIAGITDIVIRVGKTVSPTLDDNIVIEPRENADFDTSRIVVAQL